MCMCVRVCTCVHVYVFNSACVYIHIPPYMYTRRCSCVCLHIYTYVRVHICKRWSNRPAETEPAELSGRPPEPHLQSPHQVQTRPPETHLHSLETCRTLPAESPTGAGCSNSFCTPVAPAATSCQLGMWLQGHRHSCRAALYIGRSETSAKSPDLGRNVQHTCTY